MAGVRVVRVDRPFASLQAVHPYGRTFAIVTAIHGATPSVLASGTLPTLLPSGTREAQST